MVLYLGVDGTVGIEEGKLAVKSCVKEMKIYGWSRE
jgi:hypothetical protein